MAATTIEVNLREMGQNGGLFGDADERRGQARSHLVDAIREALNDGDHERARALHRHLEAWDHEGDEDEEDLEEAENLDDQSQAGRGRPGKGYGEYQPGQRGSRSPLGIENMESRQRRRSGLCYLGGMARLQEARVPRAGLRAWARSLLRD
jgi:hypothetical protein